MSYQFEKLLSENCNHNSKDVSEDDFENLSQTSSSILRENSLDELPFLNNIVDLETKTEEHVTAFLKRRYVNKQIYTWAGQTLLAIHPYEDIVSNYFNDTSVPCIDSIISKIWFRLSRNIGKNNQAVVISGESGSGKTYSACLAMKCIARFQKNKKKEPTDNILWQAWSSVPLLTAFGNASNEHNNNSSRFGKLLQLQYSAGTIVGAYIKTFLLEKSRVTGPNYQEGNFHIFQQILESVDDDTLANLYLNKDTAYKIAPKPENYLKSTYSETVKSLKILNITELNEILTILAIILNLGNINFFIKNENGYIAKDSYKFLIYASKLFQIDSDNLTQLLVTKTFAAKSKGNKRDTLYTSPCINKEECKERRNCLMRFLYNNLFLWLVERINEQIYAPESHKLIGILDVYGFEIFDTNTFEQLCINYANERLQQYFVNDHILKQRNELVAEGFSVDDIDTTEYSIRVGLLDGPVSVFGILNEECAMKRFNTDVFVNIRLADTLRSSKYFDTPGNNFSTCFVIKHFAGNVTYDTKTMLYKNRDKVPEEMISFLKDCKFPFLECMLRSSNDTSSNKTLLNKFTKSLDNLMQTLNQSDVHYVKCLKPNSFQIRGYLDEAYFIQQLRSNGIFDIFKLHFQNFCIRYNFERFIRKFSKKLYNCLQNPLKSEFHLGKKYIYLTEEGYIAFELLQYISKSIAARKIQKYWWKHRERRNRAAVTIQEFFKRIFFKKKRCSIENFIELSKMSSDIPLGRDESLTSTTSENYFANSCRKAEEYLRAHQFNRNYEGEQLSLTLEKHFNSLQTKPFKRVLFSGDHIISYNRLAEIPVRLHLSKTCIPYSNLLPKSELSKGLADIF
ncbi:Myosin head (motor domain) [Popillia japonica]|uniref:Myosin head (Motor domain) n=1 Tax=Popillia japonica TaxID=7064 RepID=A0AAW1MF18_POPJA